MHVDINRATGAGAGNIAVVVNSITISETTLPEYSSGAGKAITLRAKPGFQFDATSRISIISTTIGFNNEAIGAPVEITPTGAANELLTFALTSGTSPAQDIIRISGIRLKILNAIGAAGPSQTTMTVTTTGIGGAFLNQSIVAASILRGSADRLVFSSQPATATAGSTLTPVVSIVDFGGNVITASTNPISLSLSTNPTSAQLKGTVTKAAVSGISTWSSTEALRVETAGAGYTLQASVADTGFLTSNVATSLPFAITADAPGSVVISTQPSNTSAGSPILLAATLLDRFGNTTTTSGVNLTLDSAVSPSGWPLLTDSSLTKATVDGVVVWGSVDNLRILKATRNYQLRVSGLGDPVTTSAFNITAGSPQLLQFGISPSETRADIAVSPPPTVLVSDEFGNPTSSTIGISLTTSDASCGVGISGNLGASLSGIATFPALTFAVPCTNVTLTAESEGVVGTTSTPFSIIPADATPIEITSLSLRRNSLFQFTARGSFFLPKDRQDSPEKTNGSTLTVTGTAGSATYPLGKRGWRKAGANRFVFKSSRCDVTLQPKLLQVACRGRTGSLAVPETNLKVSLTLGGETFEFCGDCGGTTVGNPTRVFRRARCAAPPRC